MWHSFKSLDSKSSAVCFFPPVFAGFRKSEKDLVAPGARAFCNGPGTIALFLSPPVSFLLPEVGFASPPLRATALELVGVKAVACGLKENSLADGLNENLELPSPFDSSAGVPSL